MDKGTNRLSVNKAAFRVLEEAGGGPLHYGVIVERALESRLLDHSEADLSHLVHSTICKHIRSQGERSWFKRVGAGLYALTSAGIKAGGDFAPRWLDAVEIVLREAGSPMHVADIVEEVHRRGIRTRQCIRWPVKSVANEIARSIREAETAGTVARFERVEPATYRLTE